jgi:hypothetical protein
MKPVRPTRASVHLAAYDTAGQLLVEQDVSLREYCDRRHPLLDDPAYRKAHGIVRLSGVITDRDGSYSQEFEVRFDRSGLCVSDAARFPDGTVLGNWEMLRGSAEIDPEPKPRRDT